MRVWHNHFDLATLDGYNYSPSKCSESQESLATIRLVHGINGAEQIPTLSDSRGSPGSYEASSTLCWTGKDIFVSCPRKQGLWIKEGNLSVTRSRCGRRWRSITANVENRTPTFSLSRWLKFSNVVLPFLLQYYKVHLRWFARAFNLSMWQHVLIMTSYQQVQAVDQWLNLVLHLFCSFNFSWSHFQIHYILAFFLHSGKIFYKKRKKSTCLFYDSYHLFNCVTFYWIHYGRRGRKKFKNGIKVKDYTVTGSF